MHNINSAFLGASTGNISAVPLSQKTHGVKEATRHLSKVRIKWDSIKNIIVITKPDPELIPKTIQVADHLLHRLEGVNVFIEDKVLDSNLCAKFKQNKRVCSWNSVTLRRSQMNPLSPITSNSIYNVSPIIDKEINPLGHLPDSVSCNDTKFITCPEDVDFIITLGGDGTVLYASWVFQSSVPPILAFHLGTLGFMTVFDFNRHQEILDRIISGETPHITQPDEHPLHHQHHSNAGIRISLRMRLTCRVFRLDTIQKFAQMFAESSYSTDDDVDGDKFKTDPVHNTDCISDLVKLEINDEKTKINRHAKNTSNLSSPHSKSRVNNIRAPWTLFSSRRNSLCGSDVSSPNHLYSSPLDTNYLTESYTIGLRGHSLPPLPPVASSIDQIDKKLDIPQFNEEVTQHNSSLSATSSRENMSLSCVERPQPDEVFEILNDLVVDRGPSPYMSELEVYGDGIHLTTVQADGLIVSTPTGSTAYSMSAGGSIVHPEVPAILLTPICAHTLSFRPMLLPESTTLLITLPLKSRSPSAWVSFDGRHRIEIRRGDVVVIEGSEKSVPMMCGVDVMWDWFESIERCLKWNDRDGRDKQKNFLFGVDVQHNIDIQDDNNRHKRKVKHGNKMKMTPLVNHKQSKD